MSTAPRDTPTIGPMTTPAIHALDEDDSFVFAEGCEVADPAGVVLVLDNDVVEPISSQPKLLSFDYRYTYSKLFGVGRLS
jgi:hypothetical protein